ncbi:hypothetical protein Patl1_04490 [Pistacia atlantica]|uniref:Uncharacterized protein n=1 Tax=Pistacia atlantica TaxID=434234 RepID=A0ACC1BRC5_9ROSI|nr:hypothetical protein Patl1_04490 [Pistacia atlantica]
MFENFIFNLSASIERRRQSRKKKLVIIIVTSILLAMAMGVLILGWILYLRKKKLKNQGKGNEEMDLPIFDWATIANATCNFSKNNKLGEGGFGPVYKAWRLWIEGRPVELTEKSLDDSCALSDLLRCIHVGLLCVQQAPEDRPNMSTVVLMLNGERSLPQPKQPGFFTERNVPGSESSSSKDKSCSTNEITISLIEPR